MHIVLAYDIVADRRRNRLAKGLEGFLVRVQKSVFEGDIPDERYPKLRALIEREINPDEDGVRMYRLCARCVPAVEVVGMGVYIEEEQDQII
jgi:CRISPR-associated protein Cas2